MRAARLWGAGLEGVPHLPRRVGHPLLVCGCVAVLLSVLRAAAPAAACTDAAAEGCPAVPNFLPFLAINASMSSFLPPSLNHPWSLPLPLSPAAVLVGMSGQLNSFGVISHFANRERRPGRRRCCGMPVLLRCCPEQPAAAVPAAAHPASRPPLMFNTCMGPESAAPAPPAAAAVVGNQLVAANLGWPVVFGLLNVVYYVLHYMFASQVGGCLQSLRSA